MNLKHGLKMNPTNEELFQRSKKVVPGGVHSPVRSFKGLPITPRFFNKASGARITDVEGKDYIDFCMSFGPLILGHKDPIVEEALHGALSRGWSYGACEPYSLELAEFLKSQLPFIDQLRFVNSGTEAVMTAIRLARGYTKKDKILKFNGCYHGHMDSLLIKAGSGLAGESETSSQGVPSSVAQDTLVIELNNKEEVLRIFKQHGKNLAAVIIEPLPANNGLLIQNQNFLLFLREICTQENVLLIFDEVISGMRIGFKGMAGETGIIPDIVTYGKIIGGGLPVGAVAAKTHIMECLAPLGGVYQAGTLSANPLAMVAGISTLKQCTPDLYKNLKEKTDEIGDLFNFWFKNFKGGLFKEYSLIKKESLFWPVKTNSKIQDITRIPENLGRDFTPLFMALLERGIYLAPNAYEVSFVSKAHGSEIPEIKKRLS